MERRQRELQENAANICQITSHTYLTNHPNIKRVLQEKTHQFRSSENTSFFQRKNRPKKPIAFRSIFDFEDQRMIK